jgi:polysaccharide biosynthesis/export protein
MPSPAFRQLLPLILLFCLAPLSLAQRAATTLRVGDIVTVRVVAVEGYDGEYRVLTDGSITGLGFGRIVAEGKTVEELRQAITQKLRAIMLDPKVEVVLKEQRLDYVYVSGQAVEAGGPVVLTEGLTLRGLIAGKVEPPADEEFEVVLFRKGIEILREDLSVVLGDSGGMGATSLEPNDVVTVVPTMRYRVWVTGAVRTPGEHRVRPRTDVYQAVAQAGGIDSVVLADQDAFIYVRRGPEEREFPIQPESGRSRFYLEPGDTVTVRLPDKVRITVGGFVATPQAISVREGTTLLDAISQAGGVTPEGTIDDILVLRADGTAFRRSLSGVQGGDEVDNFILQDGDAVYVRRNEAVVAVLGEVAQPKNVTLLVDREYRLADVIAEAGGITPRGSERHVYVASKGDGGKVDITEYHLDQFLRAGDASQNPVLKPGDVVLVATPRGINLASIGNLLTSGALLRSLFGF